MKSSQLDSSVLSAISHLLDLNDNDILRKWTVDCTHHGGSGFSKTYKVVATENSTEGTRRWTWFMKVSKGRGMVRGEFYSLKAIYEVVPDLCPKPWCYGEFSSSAIVYLDEPTTQESDIPEIHLPASNSPAESSQWFLLTDFISHSSSARTFSTEQRLSYKLAKLHSTPVKESSGFPVTTYCGPTPQPNYPVEEGKGWACFWQKRRLEYILSLCLPDKELKKLVEEVCQPGGAVERLCSRWGNSDGDHDGEREGKEEDEPIVVVHGDLWSGNKMSGQIYRGPHPLHSDPDPATLLTGDFIFDPAGAYATPSYEHSIMNMFGGFSRIFWDEYWYWREKLSSGSHSKKPKFYQQRVTMYLVWHQLNHHAIFGGGGYRGEAVAGLRELISWAKRQEK